MNQLYITVGVPGGEFACWAEDMLEAAGVFHEDEFISALVEIGQHPVFRLAPPDAVDWVLAEFEDWIETHAGLGKLKVEGGWLRVSNDAVSVDESQEYTQYQYALTAAVFIPVPLTENLTVINPEDQP